MNNEIEVHYTIGFSKSEREELLKLLHGTKFAERIANAYGFPVASNIFSDSPVATAPDLWIN